MASGFIQRFKGKIKASQLWLDGGGKLVDAASGIGAFPHVAQKLVLSVTAVAATYFTVSLPAGAILSGITVYTTTAFTGGSALLTVGSVQGGAQYVASVSIASLGALKATLLAAAAAIPAGTPNLFFEISQTSAPTAVGAATVLIEYFTA